MTDVVGGETNSSSKLVTVFQDPKSFNVKHPLECSWTLWYDIQVKKANAGSWLDSLKKVFNVGTVEDFWGYYNNALKPSNMNIGSNYHLFKEGIKPMWEDEANKKGGKWIFPLKRNVDEHWLQGVLACIGGDFGDFNDEICGIVVSIRNRQDKLSLWTKTASNKEATELIGRKFKEALGLSASESIGYQVHSDAMKGNSSFNNKDRYTV